MNLLLDTCVWGGARAEFQAVGPCKPLRECRPAEPREALGGRRPGPQEGAGVLSGAASGPRLGYSACQGGAAMKQDGQDWLEQTHRRAAEQYLEQEERGLA